uniref:N/A n=1 Tax=Ganoderma boninense TaxID=34458 RepID=A0A5K1K8Y3_9APHY|nr:N/A [Ganoderma boninense]
MTTPTAIQAIVISVFLVAATLALSNMFFSKKWDPRGKHCLVTGGSRGTGLALAILLAKRGAHVTIVARDKLKLDKGLEELERERQDSKQIFRAFSFAVDSEAGSTAALNAAAEAHGGRCLAEGLRSELQVYGIDVHVAFPATILSPGLDEENEVKPKITLKIEETDSGSPPEDIAAGILRGVEKGTFHITMDFLGDVFRATAACASPRSNPVLDLVYGLIGFVGLPFWRRSVDAQVVGHWEEHRKYCQAKGYVP